MVDERDANLAMIDVIERARLRQRANSSMHMMMLSLMAVFFFALMACLVTGASVYRSCALAQSHANDLHLQSGLVVNAVRAQDLAGAVRIEECPYGQSLVLTRAVGDTSFETRFYHHDGYLVQESVVAGRPYDPQGATPLLKTDAFGLSLDGNLLTITCDLGSFDITLRSSGAGLWGGAA